MSPEQSRLVSAAARHRQPCARAGECRNGSPSGRWRVQDARRRSGHANVAAGPDGRHNDDVTTSSRRRHALVGHYGPPRPDRHSGQQCRHGRAARPRRHHRSGLRPHDCGQSEIRLPVHAGGPAEDARAALGPDRQHLLDRGARCRRGQRRLQRVQGRPRGPDARLCLPARGGGGDGQCGRAGPDRNRDGAAADRGGLRGTHPGRAHRDARRRSRRRS